MGAHSRRTGNKTNGAAISAVERGAKALELRKAGHTYQEIANILGYAGPQGVHDAVTKAMKRTVQEPADEVRQIEVERLDKIQLGLWERATSGQLDVIETFLRVMNRRAKLLGLDAPQKIVHSDPDGSPFLTGFAQALDTVYGSGPAGPPALPEGGS